jgi:microcystin-dependent protein
MDLYAGSTAPTGWLLAYGQEISRTTYADLFAVLSTTYGAGDGSTTFALPDMRGRVPAGLDNMGGSAASRLTATVLSAANTLGATGGTQTHTLTEAQMPVHTHIQNAHQHGLNVARKQANAYLDTGSYWAGGTSLNNEGFADTGFDNGVTVYNSYLTSNAATNQNAGSGSAHLNTQPTIVLNYIIKF